MNEKSNGSAALSAYVAHHIPGRLRLKIPAAKGHPEILEQIAAAAGAGGQIDSIECNPLTGSMIINYPPEAHDVDSFAAVFARSTPSLSMHASAPPVRAKPKHRHRRYQKPSAAAQDISSFFRSLDAEIREASENEFDLKVLLPMVVGASGLFAMRRKGPTPLWLTLLIFAFHSFMSLHAAAGENSGGLEGLPNSIDDD